MKIGIDARLYGDAGPGRYISNLLSNLEEIDKENEYIVFVTPKISEIYHPKNPNFKKWIVKQRIYSFSEQVTLPIEYLRARIDLLHVPHFNVPILYPKKFVATLHDLSMHEDSLDATTLSPYSYTIKKIGYLIVTNICSLRAKKIFVPSNVVKHDIKSKLRFLNTNKCIVTYEGVDEKLLKNQPTDQKVVETRLSEMGINDKYFLYVGSSYPHKNLQNLIISYKDVLEKKGLKYQLVIAGKIDKFSERIAGFVHALKLDYKVVFASRFAENQYIDDKLLAYLYKGADVYVFPSLREGFSITPLEAQSFGKPVVLSDINTHREIFGDSVLYFDPQSTIEMSEKMFQAAFEPSLTSKLVELGYENIKKYSWKKMAIQTAQIYNLYKTK